MSSATACCWSRVGSADALVAKRLAVLDGDRGELQAPPVAHPRRAVHRDRHDHRPGLERQAPDPGPRDVADAPGARPPALAVHGHAAAVVEDLQRRDEGLLVAVPAAHGEDAAVGVDELHRRLEELRLRHELHLAPDRGADEEVVHERGVVGREDDRAAGGHGLLGVELLAGAREEDPRVRRGPPRRTISYRRCPAGAGRVRSSKLVESAPPGAGPCRPARGSLTCAWRFAHLRNGTTARRSQTASGPPHREDESRGPWWAAGAGGIVLDHAGERADHRRMARRPRRRRDPRRGRGRRHAERGAGGQRGDCTPRSATPPAARARRRRRPPRPRHPPPRRPRAGPPRPRPRRRPTRTCAARATSTCPSCGSRPPARTTTAATERIRARRPATAPSSPPCSPSARSSPPRAA